MTTINPYLNFDGNTEEAFNFYKSVFGGEFISFQRIKEIPDMNKVPADEQNRVMHVALPIGNGIVLMGSDILPSMGHKLKVGNNYYISVSTDSKNEADRLFNGLSAGGKVDAPMGMMFWGAYFGMFTDKYGIQWMVSYDSNTPAK